jgi:hypothetical protein
MGKAAKKILNAMAKKIAYQVKDNKDNSDFLSMIESMEANKMYRVKKHKQFLFDGLNAPGSFWKSQFLIKK